jgi:hypothetical protein
MDAGGNSTKGADKMGRPKGLRKGPDGKWYMSTPEPEPHQCSVVPSRPKTYDDTLPAPKQRKATTQEWKRNDLVTVRNGDKDQAGLVLGYSDNKIVVQLLDGKTRLTLDESRVLSINELN